MLRFIGGKDPKLGWISQIKYATIMGYGIGYLPLLKNDEVLNFLENWMGKDSLKVFIEGHMTATNLREVAPAMSAPWFPEWQMKSQSFIQDALNGLISADEAAEKMISLAVNLKKG